LTREVSIEAETSAFHRSVLASAFRTYSNDYTSLIKDSALFDRDVLDKETDTSAVLAV